ncbi:MAG TPA: dihydropteroate synthase [Acidimicrobiales bacterium]|nr:dihydropteroate synthase [Acidimicrobiales bacterium]
MGTVRPLVMGVVNVTPDSFSDGGRYLDHEAAVAHGLQLVTEGADVVDVGGESTRPGAAPVPDDEERARVVPVVEALAPHVRVSVDTRTAAVAEAAVDAGATLVNDVSATLHPVAAAAGVGWVAMHMRGDPATMQRDPRYRDVVDEVGAFLVERAEAARAAGVGEVWIDPGIGFGKTTAHNLALLARLDELVATGWPVVVGTSRKRFLGQLLAQADATSGTESTGPHIPRREPGGAAAVVVPPDDRIEGSLATAVWSAAAGAGMVRVHDVAATVAALRLPAP